jgi:hypothetical protein
MRVRTLLLCACMVVVPLLAMFSHHLPPNLAVTARKTLWEPVAEWAGWKPAQTARSSPPAPAQPDAGPTPPVAAVATPQTAPLQASAAVTPSPQFATADAPDRRGLEGRLAQLGATSIGCQPLQGGSGMLASCRVAVDPAGELQRVFQAAGDDASAALGRLVAEVEAWKHRTASRVPSVPGS